VARLRRVDCSTPGIARRRRGRGFEYLDEDGRRIEDPEVTQRIRELAIPPAWKDVWICPYPMGHIQATGTDAAGRKQYRYHDRWREREDRRKFDEMVDFAGALPRLRRRVAKDLRREGLPRERVLGCAVRMLDVGFFRIGSEGYAEDNESYGLATIRKDHVTIYDGSLRFDYAAKGGKQRVQRIFDPDVVHVVSALKRRRGGGEELLAYKVGRRWTDLKSTDVNEYVKRAAGADYSAKDFRTWHATVLAAVGLAVSAEVASESKAARKRAVKRAIEDVAYHLGNTPTVARASYIDPRVFDRFDSGLTIGGVIDKVGDESEGPLAQRPIEEAVLDLIAKDVDSGALERVA
jgi:DNA topoisomerase-1